MWAAAAYAACKSHILLAQGMACLVLYATQLFQPREAGGDETDVIRAAEHLLIEQACWQHKQLAIKLPRFSMQATCGHTGTDQCQIFSREAMTSILIAAGELKLILQGHGTWRGKA